jgi:hypothetical protein
MSQCEVCEKRDATRKIDICDVCYNDLVIPIEEDSQEAKDDTRDTSGN